MKKYLITMICLVLTCLLLAQDENSFEDYLSHYKETQLPYEICLDSMWTIFSKNRIPKDYVRKYICEPGKPCDDSGDYSYDYGVRIKLDGCIALITSKLCYDCPTEYGLGTTEYLMSVYTPDGQKVSQSVILKISYQHFGYGTLTKSDQPCELLSLLTKQGTLTEFLDNNNSILKGVLDYYIYIIDYEGRIEKKKTKSSNIRVKWETLKVNILEEW